MASPFHRDCAKTGYQFIDSAPTPAHCLATFPENGYTSGHFYSTTGVQKTRDRGFHCLPPLAKTDGFFAYFHSLQFHLFFCRINRIIPHIFSFHTPFRTVWNSGIPIAYSFAQTEKNLLRVVIRTLSIIPEILL